MSSMTGFMGPSGGAGGLRGKSSGGGFGQGDKIPKGYKSGQLQQFTPEQMQLFSQLFGNLGPDSFLSQLAGGDEGAFQQSEAPAWRNLEQAYGQLGSRFSEFAPGAMSAQKGSGFKLAGSQLASDFSQDLASKRQGLQRQALFDLMGLSENLLGQRPYERFLSPKQQSQGSGWGGIGGAALGGIGGFFAGGPGGALTGAQLGYNVGSRF